MDREKEEDVSFDAINFEEVANELKGAPAQDRENEEKRGQDNPGQKKEDVKKELDKQKEREAEVRKLAAFISTSYSDGLTAEEIREDLVRANHDKKLIDDAFARAGSPGKAKAKHWGIKILLVLLLLAVIGGAYFYMTVISPTFIDKPLVERPPLEFKQLDQPIPVKYVRTPSDFKTTGSYADKSVNIEVDQDQERLIDKIPIITNQHINWIANELGGYKLHNDPRDGAPPVMEIYAKDANIRYTVTVNDNKVSSQDTSDRKAAAPDVRFVGNLQDLVDMLSTDDLKTFILSTTYRAKAKMEVLTDETTLALKGYKAVYDAFTRPQVEESVTGIGGVDKLINKIRNDRVTQILVTVAALLLIILAVMSLFRK